MFLLSERIMTVTLLLTGLGHLKVDTPENYMQVAKFFEPEARSMFNSPQAIVCVTTIMSSVMVDDMNILKMPSPTLSGFAQIVFWLALIYVNTPNGYQMDIPEERYVGLNTLNDIAFFMVLINALYHEFDFSGYNTLIYIITSIFYYNMSQEVAFADTVMQDPQAFDDLRFITAPDLLIRLMRWVVFALSFRTYLAISYGFMVGCFYIACALNRYRSLSEEVRRGKKAIIPFIL